MALPAMRAGMACKSNVQFFTDGQPPNTPGGATAHLNLCALASLVSLAPCFSRNDSVEMVWKTRRGLPARRSAAFMPLQRGYLFGVRERLVGRKPKRRERRAPDAIQRFLN
jgi:hypothetical protein